MTEREAIEVLKNLAFLSGSRDCEECEQSIDMAIKALENQSMVNELLNELKEYKELEEQGKLLRLPCGYNENLYWVFDGLVRKVCFKGIRCDKGYKPQIIARFIDGVALIQKEEPITNLENLGKTVFLTREEAEAALEKMKGEEHEY